MNLPISFFVIPHPGYGVNTLPVIEENSRYGVHFVEEG